MLLSQVLKGDAMQNFYVLSLLFLLTATGWSAEIHVPADHALIQQAIDAAKNGDVILVSPGTYVENIQFHGNAIHVRSLEGAERTFIDGNQTNSVVTFRRHGTPLSLLEGFTLFNGLGSGIPDRSGGGILVEDASPTIRNNIIEYNRAPFGGGIHCMGDSSPLIVENIIRLNTAVHHGAGIFCFECTPTIRGCTFYENRVGDASEPGWGGGISVTHSAPNIVHNEFYDNHASWAGGAIFCKYPHATVSSPPIDNNYIHDNSSVKRGGGIMLTVCDFDITNNIIQGNSSACGGGMLSGIASLICNNIISENTAELGGGLYTSNSCRLVNNTFFRNAATAGGGGFSIAGVASVRIINTIFWKDSAPVGDELFLKDEYGACTVNISSSDVMGGQSSAQVDPGCSLIWDNASMIDADPFFVDQDDADFHLSHTSPCCNRGDNVALGLLPVDNEGDPRIACGQVDMGADEFHRHLYHSGDPRPNGTVRVIFIGEPNTQQVALIAGLDSYENPIPCNFGDWYIRPPTLILHPLPPIPSPGGVEVMVGNLPTFPSGPYTLYLQAMIGYKLTNLSIMRVR
jgi:hypothetical protein